MTRGPRGPPARELGVDGLDSLILVLLLACYRDTTTDDE